MTKKAEKLITFKLVESTTQKSKEEGTVELTWGNTEIMTEGHYKTRDDNGNIVSKQLTTGHSVHPKTGERIPIGINCIPFVNGTLQLLETSESDKVKAMRECVNNRDFERRTDNDKVIYYEVNEASERLASVDKYDLIAEAYASIEKSDPRLLVEYAKALSGIETEEVEVLLNTKGKGGKDIDVAKTAPYQMLIKEMKHVAAKDAQTFLTNLNNPLRPMLAAVNEGLKRGTISYSAAMREYSWVMGNSHHTIVQVPNGVPEPKDWFSAWMVKNEATYRDLVDRNIAQAKF